jgi:HSP20 family protein
MAEKTEQAGALQRRPEQAVTRWSPWNDLETARRQMDDLISRAFGYTPLSRMFPAEALANEPDIDLFETDESVKLFASLPGYSPDTIKVEATGDSVCIEGERRALFEDDKATMHRQGRTSGSSRFCASYSLPAEVDPNNVKATFRNGVLELDMPKTEKSKRRSVKINITPG